MTVDERVSAAILRLDRWVQARKWRPGVFWGQG